MNTNNIQIRETTPDDFNDIMTVDKQAFGYGKEAKLTADLLADKTGEPMISLLAFHKDEPVGHILFTRVWFSEQNEQPMMHILAPLAIKPEYQRQGIGGMLIGAGIEKLREIDSNLVFVLGHKEYYPRYGFIPDAGSLGYSAPYPILEEFRDCWMVKPISPKGFEVGKGQIECCEAMDKPEHWRDDESDRIEKCRYKAVIFDLDGTLADSLPLCIETFRRSIEPVCGRLLTDDEIAATFGHGEEGTIAALVPTHYDECIERYLEIYDALHDEMCPAPFDGMRKLLDSLKARGVVVGLVTGKGSKYCDISLRQFGLSKFFDYVGCGSPHKDVKPLRLMEVLEKFGLAPYEVLYVGDTPSDIIACKQVGIPIASAAWAESADLVRLSEMNPGHVFLSIPDLAKYVGVPISQ